SYPVVCFRFQNIMKLFVLNIEITITKTTIMKIVRGSERQKNGLPIGKPLAKCACFMPDAV
ncbi:hypothetical protein SU67_24990, partial [Escherichia coli O139:H28 str. E24377A]